MTHHGSWLPTTRTALVPLTMLAVAGILAACSSSTGPGGGGNCDPGAGFNFTMPSSSISYTIGGSAVLDLLIQRDTAQGEIRFDVLRGMRRYGNSLWLDDTLELDVAFGPNPVPPGGLTVRMQVQAFGTSANAFTNETTYVRAFIGDATRSKECYRLLLVTAQP